MAICTFFEGRYFLGHPNTPRPISKDAVGIIVFGLVLFGVNARKKRSLGAMISHIRCFRVFLYPRGGTSPPFFQHTPAYSSRGPTTCMHPETPRLIAEALYGRAPGEEV